MLRTQVGSAEPYAAPAQQHHERNRDAYCLCERRSERCADWSHFERAHKEQVETDISRASHGDKVHRAARVAHAAEYRAYNIVCRYKRYTDKAYGQI